MKLLAITCYAGEKEYVDMTERMLRDLVDSIHHADLVGLWAISIFAQGTRKATPPPLTESTYPVIFEEVEKNMGYAVGMNRAYRNGLRQFPEADAVLCLNNDIEMPHKNWLQELLLEYKSDFVMCPKTNYTSVNEQRAAGPEDKVPYDHGVTPAVCWLMSRRITRELEEDNGPYQLFPEDLGGRAWGEDNYSSGVIRTRVNPVPFRIVPRSWIHHLGAKTSSKIPADERMRAHHEAHRRMKAKKFK